MTKLDPQVVAQLDVADQQLKKPNAAKGITPRQVLIPSSVGPLTTSPSLKPSQLFSFISFVAVAGPVTFNAT